MAELLMEFPKLSVTIDGRREPIMKRTCLMQTSEKLDPIAYSVAKVKKSSLRHIKT